MTSCDSHCVNDLLYYVEFKRKISPVNDVVALCDAFYDADDILEAKKTLFSLIGERDSLRFVARRGKSGENPSKMNLEDIIHAMNKCDNDGIALPVFVSANFAKIPQNNDGNASLNQVLYMIVEMQAQINSLERKLSSSATPSSNEITSAASGAAANDLRPAAPVFTPAAATSSETRTFAAVAVDPTLTASSSSAAAADTNAIAAASEGITREALSDALLTALPSGKKAASGLPPVGGRKVAKQLEGSAENRIKRNHDRNRNVVIGKKPSSGLMSFVGVPLTVECYVGRVGLSGSCDDVTNHIKTQNVDVVSIEENATQHQLFKSFKVVIKKGDFDTLNQRDAWPEGIHFRRFRRPRPPNTGHDASSIND